MRTRTFAFVVLALSGAGTAGTAAAKDTSYKATVDVRPATGGDLNKCKKLMSYGKPCVLKGQVFEDLNRDGVMQPYEPGVQGVLVSNGHDVVETDYKGRYRLPIVEQQGGTDIFITKPAGWDVPLDEDLIPQFSYTHMPQGSPELRFGGLEPTGPLPRRVNFPLIYTGKKDHFRVVVSGDTQPYSNNEVGYVRDTLARDIARMEEDVEFVVVEGDVMGDDLGLFPRFKKVMSLSGSPLYMVGGNHDLDFDAPTDANSFDTLRREFGPAYYSFDVGDVHFVVLDDVSYPCTPEVDNADGRHDFCDDPVGSPSYNGRINEAQMWWLYNDLKHVDDDKLIVLNMHIPIVTFIDQNSTQHQVDNALELYQLLEGRKVLSFAGHTHTLEQFRPGDVFAGWQSAQDMPAGATPFHQIVAGAACGSWWSGDFTDDGIPMAYQRLGAPRGYVVLDFHGSDYNDQYKATGKPLSEQMTLSILSPTFAGWYQSLIDWVQSDPDTRSEVTPVGINDLPDPSIVTTDDMAGGSYLVANVWNSSLESTVSVSFDGGPEISMVNQQEAQGEGFLESLDPYALERQLYVLRYAITSESGDPRAQGFEMFGGARFEGEPQPLDEWLLTTTSTHVWKAPLPADLAPGAHTARVRTVDVNGNEYENLLAFEVMQERPAPYFRSEVFE